MRRCGAAPRPRDARRHYLSSVPPLTIPPLASVGPSSPSVAYAAMTTRPKPRMWRAAESASCLVASPQTIAAHGHGRLPARDDARGRGDRPAVALDLSSDGRQHLGHLARLALDEGREEHRMKTELARPSRARRRTPRRCWR